MGWVYIFGSFGRGMRGRLSAFCCKKKKKWKGSQFSRIWGFVGFFVYFLLFCVFLSLTSSPSLITMFVYMCAFSPSWASGSQQDWSQDGTWYKTESCFLRGSCASWCVTAVLGLIWNSRWFPILNGSSLKWPYKFRIECVSFYSCFFPMTVGKGKSVTSALSDVLLFWRTFFASLDCVFSLSHINP